jgi:hypothetical protein
MLRAIRQVPRHSFIGRLVLSIEAHNRSTTAPCLLQLL